MLGGQTRKETVLAVSATLTVMGLWAGSSAVRADTLTLQAGDGKAGTAGYKDTSVWSKNEANNSFGSYSAMRVRTPSSNPRCNGLLAWPSLIGSAPDQVPANATIVSATLEVHVRSENTAGSADIWTAQLFKDWFEADGTYSGLGTHDQKYTTWLYAQAYGDGVGNVPWTNSSDPNADVAGGGGMDQADADLANAVAGVVGSGTAETWDITPIVQKWANGEANYGLLLYDHLDSGWAGYFQSKETADSDPYIPSLTIEYTTGVVIVSNSWKADADGNWSDASNWSSAGGAPNATGAVANFGAAITQPRTITLDAPATVGALNFDNLNRYTIAGTSTLTIDVASGGGTISVLNGSHTIAAPVVLAKDTTVSVAAGQTLSVQQMRGASLNVTSGTLQVIANGSANSEVGTSKLNGLTIADGAKLDLTNNSLILAYSSVGTLVGDTRLMIKNGQLISSSADAAHVLGYADNAVLHKVSFGGLSVDDSAILVKYTYSGDANLDGQVDVTDLGALATNWQSSAPWTGGDFNYDGFVDVTDLGALATNWQQGVGSPLGMSFGAAMAAVGLSGVSVPEPAAMGLIGLFFSAAATRRRRIRRH